MSSHPILALAPLGSTWQTQDPFLFCVHHVDAYPAGNEKLGPKASLAGRSIGQDFANKDGWNMYHGAEIPGFPSHPHRGFETVTIVSKGYVDHSDSLGATARFGPGDVQWLTAGKGIVHCEMFPLVHADADNPLELFQIWLNLPSSNKMVAPHFKMLWDDTISSHIVRDSDGNESTIRVIAGTLGEVQSPGAPPHSWAARADSGVAIWTIEIPAHARLQLPAATSEEFRRTLYFYAGKSLELNGQSVANRHVVAVDPTAELEIRNGEQPAKLLLLQGRPIGEPVAQHGPFVMNTQQEIAQAFADYRRDQFGGWPWPNTAPTHPRSATRFAIHADGSREEK